MRKDHPLRVIRRLTDEALQRLSRRFDQMYSWTGRPSIPPEKLLRALLLQILYTIRSERLLMEQLDYNLLFRWFVGLNMDDAVWDATVFSKNRDRLLEGDVAEAFFDQVLAEAQGRDLLSDEHFTVDGTLVEAWASQKSFQKKDAEPGPPPEGSGQSDRELSWRERQQRNTAIDDGPGGSAGAERERKRSEAELCRACADGESPRAGGERPVDIGDGDRRTGCGGEDDRADPRAEASHRGSRQELTTRTRWWSSCGNEE